MLHREASAKIKKFSLGAKPPSPASGMSACGASSVAGARGRESEEVKMQDLSESSGEAEADTVATVTGGVPEAASRAEEVRTAEPRAAAQNTLIAIVR